MAFPKFSGRAVKKREVAKSVLQQANVAADSTDLAGMDPSMVETLKGEAARRVGAAGVQVQTRDPLAGIKKFIKSHFGKTK